ncbi:MAG: hypothetical protein E7638_05175 [Ruminococcaceae bacterium]|nr:hypothetical protein [Oscillospiraceae bacterium]
MKMTISLKTWLFFAVSLTMGMAAGFLNGLTGTGAGIIFLLLFRLTGGEISKDTFAFSMSCVIPLSAFSLFTYRPPEPFSFATFAVTLLTGAVGGVAGAFLQQKLKIGILKKVFAALVIYSGINMILK